MRVLSRSWIFVAAAALVATAGCSKLNMDQQPCPCATGWTCCANSNVCVKNKASCGSADAGGVMADAASPPPTLQRVVIATGQASPEALATDTDRPIWTNGGDGSLMSWPTAPQFGWPPRPDQPIPSPVKVSTFAPGKLAVYGDYVADDADGTIAEANLDGAPTILASGQLHPRAVVRHKDYIYWTSYGDGDTQADGTVERVPAVEGGPAQVLASGLAGPGPLAVSDTYVYFATVGKTAGSNEILRVPIAGGHPEVLATGQTQPSALYFDGALEWTTSADGSSSGRIMRMTFPDGNPEVILDDAHNPTALYPPFFVNDNGINRLVYPQSSGGSVTTKLVVPLDPEQGRSIWDLYAPSDSTANGLVWTNPQEGTVEALLYRQ